MITDWLLFGLSALALWFPRQWMRAGASFWRRRRRSRGVNRITSPRDGAHLTLRLEVGKPRNSYDFIRAAAGAAALTGAYGLMPVVTGTSEAPAALGVWTGRAVILLTGVAAQLFRWERGKLSLAAPVFYLGGLTLGLGAPMPAAAAFVTPWLLGPLAAHPAAFFTIQAIVYGAVGALLHGASIPTVLGIVLCFFPVLASLLLRRPLVAFARRGAAMERTA